MKLDFAKFKKVKSDGHCTTLRHDDGHEIRIAHKALSKKTKKDLSSIPQHFAEGGEVEEDEQKNSAKKFGISNDQLNEINSYEVPESQRSPSSEEQEPLPGTFEHAQWEDKKRGFTPVVDQPKPEPAPGSFAAAQEKDKHAYDVPVSPAPVADTAGPSPASVSPPAPSTLAPQVTQNPDPYGYDQYDASVVKGMKMQQAGIAQQANAESQLAKENARLAHEQQQHLQEFQKSYSENQKKITAEIDNVVGDIKNKQINPKHYMESMTTGQRVGTAIGLILSGFGSALTGGENVVLKMLNQQIDRDIDAQRANLGKSESLLNAYYHQFGNMNDAMNMAKATNAAIYASQMQEAAAKSSDPAAKARAMEATGKLYAQYAPILQQLAMKKSVAGMMNSGQNTESSYQQKVKALTMVDKDAAKEAQENYIPGVGVASIKPTDKDRDSLVAAKQIKSGLTELIGRARTIGTTIPGTEADRVNKTKVASLQLQMKTAYQLGVLSQSDLDMLDKLVANPGNFMTKNAISQLESTRKSMAALETGVMKKLGVKPFADAVTGDAESNPNEGRTARDSKGNRIVMKNGKWVAHE